MYTGIDVDTPPRQSLIQMNHQVKHTQKEMQIKVNGTNKIQAQPITEKEKEESEDSEESDEDIQQEIKKQIDNSKETSPLVTTKNEKTNENKKNIFQQSIPFHFVVYWTLFVVIFMLIYSSRSKNKCYLF